MYTLVETIKNKLINCIVTCTPLHTNTEQQHLKDIKGGYFSSSNYSNNFQH